MKATDLAQYPDVQLLDVRLAEDYEAEHLTGAVNNCVFEISFADRLHEAAPDKSAATIVYGANAESHEAEAAAEKLRRLKYTNIHLLEGGLASAKEAQYPTTRGKPLPEIPQLSDGVQAIDTDESEVKWTGRNLLNKHWGTVAIASGQLQFSDQQFVGGTIELDLKKFICTDLANTDLHDVLIAHLHNDDFFDVENHPTALLKITKVTPIADAVAGAPNLGINAELTLRGQSHPIHFEAATGITPEGKAAAQAVFSIDRTRWGVLYGSGKFFHRLAGHLVNDFISFDVKIVTS